MKYLFSILILITCCYSMNAYSSVRQGKINNLDIIHDTVFHNKLPYCLLTENNETYSISTLQLSEISYITTITRNGRIYLAIEFTPLKRVYYTEQVNGFLTEFLHVLIKHEVIEDGYFNPYGANMLIEEKKRAGQLKEEWELPANESKAMVLNWNISWKSTDNDDSTVILADGVPFAYYTYRSWRDYGVDKFPTMASTKAAYRYFIYSIDANEPMAEVRVADWWITGVTVITPDNKQYFFKDIPKNDDFLTVVAKLLLARQVFEKK
jgi:hypothetical protein